MLIVGSDIKWYCISKYGQHNNFKRFIEHELEIDLLLLNRYHNANPQLKEYINEKQTLQCTTLYTHFEHS